MPSHFSTIGFPDTSDDHFTDCIERAIDQATPLEVDRGVYLRWASDAGAQLWVQIDADGTLVGAHPHFDGASTMTVGLVEPVERPRDTVLDGAYSAWADPPPNDLEAGAYPFVFALPDFYASPVSLPCRATAQIAAFAHEIELYEDEEQYLDSQEDEVKFAAQSFIPSGLFDLEAEEERPPEAKAILTGRIRECDSRRNECGDRPFWWMQVDSLGGTFDVVVDPVLMTETPQVGGVVSGAFWLSGRLVTTTPSEDRAANQSSTADSASD